MEKNNTRFDKLSVQLRQAQRLALTGSATEAKVFPELVEGRLDN